VRIDNPSLFEGSDFENLTVDSGTTFPTGEDVGELFFRTDTNKLFVYDGSSWVDTTQAPGDLTTTNHIDTNALNTLTTSTSSVPLAIGNDEVSSNTQTIFDRESIQTRQWNGSAWVADVLLLNDAGGNVSVGDTLSTGGNITVPGLDSSSANFDFTNTSSGGSFEFVVTDGVAQETGLVITGAGSVEAYYSGNKAVDTGSRGMNFYDPNQSSVLVSRIWADNAGNAYWQGQVDGQRMIITADDSGGVARTVFDGDPDGSVILYYDSTTAFYTTADGIDIRPATGSSTEVRLRDSTGGNVGILHKTGTNFRMRGLVNGDSISLQAQSSGGVQTNILTGNPDGALDLYANGTLAFSTDDVNRGITSNGNSFNITVDDNDFIVRDSTDGVSNFIWRDHSAGVLNLGTANAVATFRSDVNVNDNNIDNARTIDMTGVTGDKLSLFADRIDATNMYGFGVESNVLYAKSPSSHGWYINTNADGSSYVMDLSSARLQVNANLETTGELNLERVGGGIIDSTENGSNIRIRAATTGGVMTDVFRGNADNWAGMYHNGTLAIYTSSSGGIVQDTSGDDPTLYFRDDTGSNVSLLWSFNGSTYLDNLVNSGEVYLRGNNSGGSITQMARFDPDGGAVLNFTGSTRLETTTTGVTVTGDVTFTGDLINNTSTFYIDNTSAGGNIVLRTNDSNGDIVFMSSTVEQMRIDPAAQRILLENKEAIDYNDSFLRLNQNGDFASGVYTPGDFRSASVVRADDGFQVGATPDWLVGSTGRMICKTYVDMTFGFHGSYNDEVTGDGTFGAPIWSIGDAWVGTESGPNGGDMTSNGYGMAWLRDSNTNAISGALEGLYLYRAGTRIAAIGRSGAVFTNDVTANSDARIKTDIEQISDALEKVQQIRGVTFRRTDTEDNVRHAGVIAQEVEKVLPEVVKENDGIKSVAYGNMVSLLIEAVKDLSAEVKTLKIEIAELKDK
jgi:hypothetical protein